MNRHNVGIGWGGGQGGGMDTEMENRLVLLLRHAFDWQAVEFGPFRQLDAAVSCRAARHLSCLPTISVGRVLRRRHR